MCIIFLCQTINYEGREIITMFVIVTGTIFFFHCCTQKQCITDPNDWKAKAALIFFIIGIWKWKKVFPYFLLKLLFDLCWFNISRSNTVRTRKIWKVLFCCVSNSNKVIKFEENPKCNKKKSRSDLKQNDSCILVVSFFFLFLFAIFWRLFHQHLFWARQLFVEM